MVGALILCAWAQARVPHPRPAAVVEAPGRDPTTLVVKFRDDVPARWTGRWEGVGAAAGLEVGDARVVPRFREAPEGPLARYFRIHTADAVALGNRLLRDPRVETAYLAWLPAPPPEDLPPVTPDFSGEQLWLDAIDGLGFTDAARHPGGRGEAVRIADLEYGWDPDHEDLEAAPEVSAWGLDTGYYAFHGNSVLGQLVGGDNGYGVVGAVPEAQSLVVSPFDLDGSYDVAAAIVAATALLGPGDVLLIEQQAWVLDSFGPVEIDPGVFDAIRAATDAGVVVVEPAGNGALDLDAPELAGWFDRSIRDSGAILVGGGASPLSGYEPRTWYPYGSCYGSRVDVQGWYDSIVTATGGDYDGYYADLYYPGEDGRQAYTRSFGGTSGASPMVAAIAAIAQSVAITTTGAPWTPEELRAALVATGTPQPVSDPHPIGPEPNLRRLLRARLRP